jgi:hypothetical protein
MNRKIEVFWNVLHQRGLNKKDELLRELLRVKFTDNKLKDKKLDINTIINNSDKIFKLMKESTEEVLGYFPGDRDFFLEIFQTGREIDLLEFAIQTFKNDRTGRVIAPGYLINYLSTIITEQKGLNTILIPEAEKSLVGLKELITEHNKIQFTLTSEDNLMFLLLKTVFMNYNNVIIIHQSIYKRLILKDRYDLIYCIPAFGLKFDTDDFSADYITGESDGIAVENLLQYLSENGIMYSIVPVRFAFSGGNFERLRKHILSKYNLQSLYTLPEGTFRPYTGIKTMFLSISQRENDSIKLGNLSLENNKFFVSDEKEIETGEFNKYSDWRIDLFLAENQHILKRYKTSEVKKKKLKEIADIFRGKSIMKKDLKPGEIYVLNISNIENGQILYHDLDTIDEEERKIKRYELIENDLLITCRGTINKVAVYKEAGKLVIASANIITVRFKGDILSEYVKIFLESPVGTTIIKSFQRGSTVMNINPGDIGELEIPVLPLEKQKQIVEEYLSELDAYTSVINRAEKRWRDKKSQLYQEILG